MDHIIVLGEMHLRRVVKSYADYYNVSRTHRSLNKDAPLQRRLSASAPSSHDLSLAAFTINIAESNFRHTQGDRFFGDGAVPFRRLLERLQQPPSITAQIAMTRRRRRRSARFRFQGRWAIDVKFFWTALFRKRWSERKYSAPHIDLAV